ncbi:MAG: NADH-quinone oxidoreductase subunit H [Candidatus Thermoplasmatota archaeon]|nr:NADH-quinone oxidoreductase subunit H [Candidatus Thermoplasmatota archaeon]
MNWPFLIYIFVNAAFALLISPFYMSLIKKIKAWTQRRKGPPLFQTYYNIAKLMKKEVVYSSNSSWIMRTTPYANMIAVLAAAMFVPLAFVPQGFDGVGNIILFVYLLAVARFFMALSGLDAGSTFGGMGSSREMSLSAIIEPTTIVVFAALAFTFKTTNLHEIFTETAKFPAFVMNPSLFLISIPLFLVIIVETARVPVDNPETHLELTMIHEAMILEQSGRNLALMELSSAVKQTLLTGVLVNVLMPWGLATEFTLQAILFSMLAFFAKAAAISIIIGLFESALAKIRLFLLPHIFMLAFFLSVLAILLEVF